MTRKIQLIVAEAAVLNREIKERSERLVELKEAIRAEAVKRRTADDERIEFESSEGTATVAFPKDKLGIVKGADPHALRDTLTDAAWNQLFAFKVTLADEAEDALAALKGAAKKAVDKVLAFTPSTPTVTLPK